MLKEEKSVSQISSEYGVHPNQLYRWKAQVLEELPSLFEKGDKTDKAQQAAHDRQVKELYAEIGKLTTQLAWLKKNLASSLSKSERYQLVEWDHPALTIKVQAELLSLNRTNLYYQPKGPSPEEIAMKHRIDEIYTTYPFYGSRRIQVTLSKEGWDVSRPTVQRYMREMGIRGISPGPNLSKASSEHKIYPYLLRNLSIERPNRVWGIDITYIRLHAGWMYLVAIMDWFSRYVLSWELDQTLEMPFVLEAVAKL